MSCSLLYAHVGVIRFVFFKFSCFYRVELRYTKHICVALGIYDGRTNLLRSSHGYWKCLFVCWFLTWMQRSSQLCSLSMCMFDKFHLTIKFKSKMSRGIFKKKNECQLTSTVSSRMSPQCHNLVVHVISICKSVNWRVGFFFPSHTTCQNLNFSVNWGAFYFCASFCVTNIKNL